MCRIDSYAVYTNRPPAGALRGFGVPQLLWAYECHTDMIARGARHGSGRIPAQEPAARRAAARKRHGASQTRRSSEVLDRVAERFNWEQAFDRGRGRCGAAAALPSASRRVISPTTSVAIVNVSPTAVASLYIGTVDMGQGSDTAMAQIVGEVLDIAAERSASCTRIPT